MEVVYGVDLKIPKYEVDLKQILKLDVSSLNILAFSCTYLPISNQLNHSPHLISSSLHQTAKSSFCIYICSLEQPWYSNLISVSIFPITQLVWNLDGTHLLICNQAGLCQILQIKNGCINTMEKIYQYQINEDILCAKCIFPRASIVVHLDKNESIFFKDEIQQSPQLKYALSSSNFVCVTTSGTIHTLPVDRSQTPFQYSLSTKEPLNANLCDIHPTEQGFHIILSEQNQGAAVRFFVVHYNTIESILSYLSCQSQGFRIPSCYGQLKSLFYFQRHSIDCILTYTKSFTGDIIDLYEYNIQRREWISLTLLNSPQASITSISFSPNQFIIENNHYQGLFGRQILICLNDGSIVCFDKLNLHYREQYFILKSQTEDFFLQIKHTYSGSCALGLTDNGSLVLFRTISLEKISSLPLIINLFIHLFEQYIVQNPSSFDLWDILCLLPMTNLVNQLIDCLVFDYNKQSIEFQRNYFLYFKKSLYYIHRLLNPFDPSICGHLTSLLIYTILLIHRDYLRLFIYEPTNRNFVDATREILQQRSFHQNLDTKRIKYLNENKSSSTNPYELIYFTHLIDWITDLILYLIGYHQSQELLKWIQSKEFFQNLNQLEWLRELIVYFNILNQMKKISNCKISNLNILLRSTGNINQSRDLFKDIYHSLTKFSENIQNGKHDLFAEEFLENCSVLDLEILQSKIDRIFPKFYRFLLPNQSTSQYFIRDSPPYIDYHSQISPQTQFDIITVGKLSLSSNPIFRRCLRCSNYSRLFSQQPYPILVNQLNHQCICGGLFLLYKVR